MSAMSSVSAVQYRCPQCPQCPHCHQCPQCPQCPQCLQYSTDSCIYVPVYCAIIKFKMENRFLWIHFFLQSEARRIVSEKIKKNQYSQDVSQIRSNVSQVVKLCQLSVDFAWKEMFATPTDASSNNGALPEDHPIIRVERRFEYPQYNFWPYFKRGLNSYLVVVVTFRKAN